MSVESATNVDVEELEAAWIGGHMYRIWSEADTQNAYTVDLTKGTCDCMHGRSTADDATEACKHIKKAILCHDSSPNLKKFTFEQLADLYSETWDVLKEAENARNVMKRSQEAFEGTTSTSPNRPSENGSGSADSGSEGGEDADEDDGSEVTEFAPNDAQEQLVQSLSGWFEDAAQFNSFDPDIIDLSWGAAGNEEGVIVERQPFSGNYYDDGEWQDRETFEEHKETAGDIMSNNDAFQWYGEPDYVYFVSEDDVSEVTN